ncbi:MAG: DUF2752 domain-containing protein [Deltaproteobacteria bacterium]|nr:DUF2752 domain-containing protein [Deltaproteobacteria bacterium]
MRPYVWILFSFIKTIFPVVVLLVILTAGWWVAPEQVAPIPLCGFKYLFGIDCPGCGLTRSFLAIARGDILDAFHYNAAGPLIYLFLGGYAVDLSLKGVRGKGLNVSARASEIFGIVVGLLLFGHWIIRLANGPTPEWPALLFFH